MTHHDTLKIAILVGSNRPGRRAAAVAAWVRAIADQHGGATYDVLDLADHPLPFFDEEVPPIIGAYQQPHTLAWAATIAQYDAFVVIAPEYNHSISAVLKNAIDYLYAEWNDKAVGVVAYGAEGGTRAVEHLRQIFGELQAAVVRQHVAASLYLDFEDFVRFEPRPELEAYLQTLLDQVISWGGALRGVRLDRETETVA